MDNPATNNFMSDEDYKALQERSVRLKFSMQLCGALAGATFLAVLGVVGQAMMASTAVISSAAAHGAVVGFAAVNWPVAVGMIAVGLAFTYLSCRFMNSGNMLEIGRAHV